MEVSSLQINSTEKDIEKGCHVGHNVERYFAKRGGNTYPLNITIFFDGSIMVMNATYKAHIYCTTNGDEIMLAVFSSYICSTCFSLSYETKQMYKFYINSMK